MEIFNWTAIPIHKKFIKESQQNVERLHKIILSQNIYSERIAMEYYGIIPSIGIIVQF
jgi:hypothetical protein